MSRRRAGTSAPVAIALALLTLASLLAVFVALVGRTLVPFAVEGRVISIDERNRDPGTEVWVVNMADGERWFVDDDAARAFRPGVVSKPAWSRTVRTGTTERSIGPGRDLLAPALWSTLTAAGIGVSLLTRRRPARRSPHRQDDSSTSSQLNTTRSPTVEATRPA